MLVLEHVLHISAPGPPPTQGLTLSERLVHGRWAGDAPGRSNFCHGRVGLAEPLVGESVVERYPQVARRYLRTCRATSPLSGLTIAASALGFTARRRR